MATSDNLVLGKGKLYFAPYPKGLKTGGIKGYLGNTPQVNVAQTSTKLDHYSSEGGLKIKNASIVLQSDQTITFDTDDMSLANIALWFGGNNTDTLPSDAPTDLGTMRVVGAMDAAYGELFYESDNPVGDNVNYWWPYVNLTPTGSLPLKGDTWQQMQFTAEALKRDNATERVYVFGPTAGASTAAADTTARLTVSAVQVGEAVIATTATVTATSPQVNLIPFDVTFTLNGGTAGDDLMAFLFINSGSVLAATRVTATGSAGVVSMTAPSAGTVTVKAFDNFAGTGTAIGTSSNIVVS